MGISHLYLYLTDLCPIRQNVRLKNTFADIAYNVLVKTKILQEHKETCLKTNDEQSVKLKSGSIKSKTISNN